MRQATVLAELDLLWIDQDELDFVRRARDQQRGDQAVDAHALARPGRACDEQVRHAREVADDRLAGHVHPDADGQARTRELRRGDQVAQLDRRHRRVGYLDADHGSTWHRGQHPQRRGAKPQRQVVLALDDAVHCHPRRGIEAELRDRRALLHLNHTGLDIEGLEGVFDDAGAGF